MSKIEKLTRKQISKFPEYVDKWLRIGLSTERIDRDASKINNLRKKVLGLESNPVIFMDGPMDAYIATMMLQSFFCEKDQVWSQVWSQVWDQVSIQVWEQVGRQVSDQVSDQVRNQVWDQVSDHVRDQVWDQVWDQVRNQVWDQVSDQVSDQVWSQVWRQVRNNVWRQVRNQVWDQFRRQVRNQVRSQIKDVNHFILPYICGHLQSHYFVFYDFFSKEHSIQLCDAFWEYMNVKDYGNIYPMEHFTVVSDRPCSIIMKNRMLHKDGGPAVEYLDGTKVWCLNGVRVTKEVAETKSSELDPKIIFEESNAEVRREIIKKIGIERVCQRLNARVLDKTGDYELLNLDFGENRIRPYLKMINPSTGAYHIEGVHPECRCVLEALNWRNGTTEMPEVLT